MSFRCISLICRFGVTLLVVFDLKEQYWSVYVWHCLRNFLDYVWRSQPFLGGKTLLCQAHLIQN